MQPQARTADGRIVIFDALRGYCALWVIFVHLSQLLELQPVHAAEFLWNGYVPVDIFFILSGYVIAGLLENRRESYGRFLFRRYFRLAPVLIVLCLLYLWQLPLIVSTLHALNPRDPDVTTRLEIFAETAAAWQLHLPLHASLLYGLIEGTLPHATKTIIPPAWSITVEWQFYLLAPLLVAALRKQKAALLVLALFAVHKVHPVFGSLITDHFQTFGLGIVSYFMLAKRSELPRDASSLVLILSLIAWVGGLPAVALWGIFVLCAYGQVPAWVRSAFLAVFGNRFGELTGRISYSIYLAHMIVFYACMHWLFPGATLDRPWALFVRVLPAVLVFTLLFSLGLYYAIEKPCMDFAKRVADRFAPIPARPLVAPDGRAGTDPQPSAASATLD